MDKSYVKSTIKGLKSHSSSQVQETLLKIKSKITVNNNGIKLFRECGGLECLLPHLRKPNERILSITLSILGNCCLEEESSLKVGSLNSFGPLILILKNVYHDSIIGRTCRLIGNLAQKCTNADGLHNHGAVAALVTVIEKRDKNTSYPTLTMAVRAIRCLWLLINRRDEMLEQNAVRCVALLLTTECESAGIILSANGLKEHIGFSDSRKELINGILKCVGYFTMNTSSQCAEQIQGDGRGYQCLVALTNSFETLALKCLMNLCYISSCRPLLGTAGLVECLVTILKNSSEVSWWPEGAARALAHLSGESVNRSRLRYCGGLPLLVAAARDSHHAMHALLQYVFDDSSFQILINGGLVNLLTDELTKYLTSMEYEHNNMDRNYAMNESADIANTIKGKIKDDDKLNRSEIATDIKEIKESKEARAHNPSKNVNDLKVVIERDNMIVGFVDAVDSDASDDSHSDDEKHPRRKCLKRTRPTSPKMFKKNAQTIKMTKKDWSAGVYWEPKSPEWPSTYKPGSQNTFNLDRPDHSPLSSYSDGNQSGFSPEYRGSCSKRSRFDWSPESDISAGEGSFSCLNWFECQWNIGNFKGPTPPYSTNEESSDSEISGRYSPVCSEAEPEGLGDGEVRGSGALDVAQQVAQDLDELIMDDDESDDEPPLEEAASKIDASTQNSRIACVFVLLFRISHGACSSHGYRREEPVANHTSELLAGQDCLNALLDYVQRCKKPLGRAARILVRVLNNASCLMSILKHRITLRLYDMSVNSKHPPAKCQQCRQIVRLSTKLLSQLSTLAESNYGTGEISYQFSKGNTSMKQTLTLTLPYIIRTEKLLKKYFLDYNALNLLCSLILESKEDIRECVTAMAKLANNVGIKDPKTLENRFKDQICVSYDPILDNLTQENIVTFELDDSSTVQANKVFLCQNSEVFSAMLMGRFKESTDSRVRLKNVTKLGLEYLLTLLHSGLDNAKCDVVIFPLSDRLETNLEVLLLADRFLFEKLKGLLTSAILQFVLSPNTADKMYVWSLCDGMGFLCVESVAYLLTGKMSDSERVRSFETILNLEYKEQWLEDIKALICRQLVK